VHIPVRTPYFVANEKTATYFGTRPEEVNAVRDVDIDNMARVLSAQVEHWNSRGSGFIIERVNNFIICITKCRPLYGSSYIPTPKRIADKVCTTNVKKTPIKNALCGRCWLPSILPMNMHIEESANNYPMKNIKHHQSNFPLALKDIPKFEILNPSISVSLDAKDFCIEYCRPERNRPHYENLLLLSQEDKKHYVCIKNMSCLVGDRTKT